MVLHWHTGADQPQKTTTKIRDMKTLKSTTFHGNHLFYWESLGSQVEIEFNGDFSQDRVSFRAQYWARERGGQMGNS
ncbi:hypothetical protein GDO78_012908 [Eleutherodactylus coqui]|uniref:Uncharacterized protein n=1 Tax=Eleutherodactylus coqui TaxID=57060 RepID=A0A8J6K382_ELECQ|nr:hypothetical protein GDO78_012908 [Eleutherodactylus coqui]